MSAASRWSGLVDVRRDVSQKQFWPFSCWLLRHARTEMRREVAAAAVASFLFSFAEAEQEEAIKAEQHPLLPLSQTASKYYLTLFRTADRMSASSRRDEHQQAYLRQATILRKNLVEWDETIRSPQGANWPSMLGRLNAAMVSCTVGVRCWQYWCG